jgi:hypothetical protein
LLEEEIQVMAETRIFISHSHTDRDVAVDLNRVLFKYGAEVFLDQDRIEAGDPLPSRLRDGIQWCNRFLLLWSRTASQSMWVQEEWDYAYNLKKGILPYVLDGTPLPNVLEKLVYVDAQDRKIGHANLLSAVFGKAFTPPDPTELFPGLWGARHSFQGLRGAPYKLVMHKNGQLVLSSGVIGHMTSQDGRPNMDIPILGEWSYDDVTRILTLYIPFGADTEVIRITTTGRERQDLRGQSSIGRTWIFQPPRAAPPDAEPVVATPETAGAVSLPATVPAATRGSATPESSPTGAEPGDTAVLCPSHVARDSVFLVQFFLYPPRAATEVDAQARQADEAAERRGTYSLPLDLPLGTRVALHLEMPVLTVPEPDAVLVWRGSPTAAQFEVAVPADAAGAQAIGRVRIAVAGVPLGTLRFQVALTAAGTTASAANARELRARRYRRAFVSYSSEDRAEVLRRVQAFRIAGLSVFQDILDLDPGERWQKALYREIDQCDVFLLFWSHAAAASEWVGKEIDYALARKQGDEERPPDIQPVPIEGPPIVPPPASLSGVHFNDALLAQIHTADPDAG